MLIIVTGAPGTGKTTLGMRVAQTFRLPFFHKDGLKETLFNSLGWSDRAWSKRLGTASVALLYYCIEVQLQAGRSFVVESNFLPEYATQEFLELKHKYPFEPFQILCRTDGEVLTQRYRRRAESSERHPGHVDHVLCGEFDADALQRKHGVLDIGGHIVRVDTTDFEAIDYEELFQMITLVAGNQIV